MGCTEEDNLECFIVYTRGICLSNIHIIHLFPLSKFKESSKENIKERGNSVKSIKTCNSTFGEKNRKTLNFLHKNHSYWVHVPAHYFHTSCDFVNLLIQ